MLELKSHNFIQITTYFQTIAHFCWMELLLHQLKT